MRLPNPPQMSAEDALGMKIGLLLLAVTHLVLRIVAPTLLWRWFAVPFGLPEIGFMHMFGLLLLFTVFTYEKDGDVKTTTPKKLAENVSLLLTALLLGLGVSYLI